MSTPPPPPEPLCAPMTMIGGYFPTWLAKVRQEPDGSWVYAIFANGSREPETPPPPYRFTSRRKAARAARSAAKRLNRIAETPALSKWSSV